MSVAKRTTGKYKDTTLSPKEIKNGMKLRMKSSLDFCDTDPVTGLPACNGLTIFPNMQRFMGKIVTVDSTEFDGKSMVVFVKEAGYGFPIEMFEMP